MCKKAFKRKWCAEILIIKSRTPVPAIILELILEGGWRGNEDILWSPNRSGKFLVQSLNREVCLITENPIKLIVHMKGWSDQLQKAIEDTMNSEFN